MSNVIQIFSKRPGSRPGKAEMRRDLLCIANYLESIAHATPCSLWSMAMAREAREVARKISG